MAHQQKIAIAHDGLQKIVEIMRHPAGQLTDGLHLLGLGELRLERLLFGGVDDVEDGAGFAFRTGHEGAGKKLRRALRRF